MIHEWMDWGVGVIVSLQRFSPTLDAPFKALTFLGNEAFYLVFLPLLYWSVDRRTGARLIILFLVSACLNDLAKILAGQPRPFQYSPLVQPLCSAGGGGFPSGHTQGAVVIWGYLATQVRKPWMWILSALLIVLIPLSRLYLGVHFPTDLAGGYLIGGTLLGLYLLVEPGMEAWLRNRTILVQLATALVGPGSLFLLAWWAEGYSVRSSAALLGMATGFVLERRWVGFASTGPVWKRGLRFLVGLSLLVAFRVGLAALGGAGDGGLVSVSVPYLFLGLGGALICPWVFVWFRIAPRTGKQAQEGP